MNSILKEKKQETNKWCTILNEAAYKKNITIHTAIKKIPYEAVFGMLPIREVYTADAANAEDLDKEDNPADTTNAEEPDKEENPADPSNAEGPEKEDNLAVPASQTRSKRKHSEEEDTQRKKNSKRGHCEPIKLQQQNETSKKKAANISHRWASLN